MLPTLLRSMPVIVASMMVARRVSDQVGLFDERYRGGGDWDFCVRASQHFPFGFVDAPLTLYRKHATNSGNDPTRLRSEWQTRDWWILGAETMPAAARMLHERAARDGAGREEAALALASLGTIYATRADDPARAREMFRLALRLQPTRAKTWLRYMTTFLPRRAAARRE